MLSLVPTPLNDRNNRESYASGNEAVLDGGRGILVPQEPDDQAHKIDAPKSRHCLC